MSEISELFIPRKTLMRWREPNAYSRKDLSHCRWIGLLIVLMIPTALLTVSAVNHNFSRGRIILALFFMVMGVIIFIRVWFGPGDVVCLKEDHLTKATSRPPRRTYYKNIENCYVNQDSCNGIKFFVLKFTFQKGLPSGEVDKVVTQDVNINEILQILRDKGINVIER